MSVSWHKSVQSLATYQKTTSKEKLQMGSVMYQSLTRKEDDIQVPSRQDILPKPVKNSLPAPQALAVNDPNPKNAVAIYQPPQEKNEIAKDVIPNKPNSDDAVVLFQANFDMVPDFDILSAMCEIQDVVLENRSNIITPVTYTVFNNIPRNSMFSYCSIGTINFINSPK